MRNKTHPDITRARRIYALDAGDIERFDQLYRSGSRGKGYRRSVVSEAKVWRTSLRRELKTDKRCRYGYLAAVCHRVHPPTPDTPMPEIPSAARYMCWRVESEVRRLDAKKK